MDFSSLASRAGSCPVEYLQLGPDTTEALDICHITTIGELIQLIDAGGHDLLDSRYATNALEDLAKATDPQGPDWYAYWESRDFEFHHMCLTCRELEAFDETTPVCAINKGNFGKAAAPLVRSGYDTLGKLAQGLRSGLDDVRGMGGKKRVDFFQYLVSLIRVLRTGRVTPDDLTDRFPLDSKASPDPEDWRPIGEPCEFGEEAANLSVGILHACIKADTLETAGYRTVGDLAAASTREIVSLPRVTRTKTDRIAKVLTCLDEAQTSSGGIDWDKYCDLMYVDLLPPEGVPAHGTDFVIMIREAFAGIGEVSGDPVLEKIILERTSKPLCHKATLREIGTSFSRPISEQTIHRKERELIESVSAALFKDDYCDLGIHFRPGFSDYWKKAATHFSDRDGRITFTALVDELVDIWDAGRGVVIHNLSLIEPLLVHGAGIDPDPGDAMRIDPELFTLSEEDRSIPLRHLQIGRVAQTLGDMGMETLGDLISQIGEGTVTRKTGRNLETAILHLDKISASLDKYGHFDPAAYLEQTGTRSIPSRNPDDPREFMQDLSRNVSEILSVCAPYKQCDEIFDIRTSQPIASRPSLKEVGAILGTHGTSVRSIEAKTLSWLEKVILEDNRALAGVAFPPAFIETWKTIRTTFSTEDGDPEPFRKTLALDLGISQEDIEPAMPTMIAVLTGRPYGRLDRGNRRKGKPG